MKLSLCILVVTILFARCAPWASGQSYSSEDGHVQFTSSVPLHEFTGSSDQLVGRINLADSTVDFYVDLTTLETGIGKRDKDMRRSLETDTYPFAEFYGKLVSGFDQHIQSPQPAIVRGRFTIHGVSREIEVTGTLQLIEEELRTAAAWDLNLEDYQIVPPSLLIVRVDEIQEVSIDVTLIREQ